MTQFLERREGHLHHVWPGVGECCIFLRACGSVDDVPRLGLAQSSTISRQHEPDPAEFAQMRLVVAIDNILQPEPRTTSSYYVGTSNSSTGKYAYTGVELG